MIHYPAARCLALLSLLAAGVPGRAAGQYPRSEPGRFEVRGLDFRRNGAWRRRTGEIRDHRRALLRAGALGTLNAPTPAAAATRVVGVFHVPVLLVQPANVTPLFQPAEYQSILFDPSPTARPYSLHSFYAQLSNGNVTLEGTVRGWWKAPEPNTYYEDGCNGVGVLNPCPHPTRMGELLLGALQAFDDGTFDWGRFDNDGPDGIPNSGDDDGYVDFVTFIHPDVDGACGTVHLWAHRWVLSAWNGGVPYTTKTPWTGHPGQTILVEDYTLQSGVGGSTACTSGQLMPIGTVAHETGHAFGLPDLYDTDLSSPSRTQGIGEWGLMGSGNYRTPDSPARMEAWSLLELGWVGADTLNASRTLTASPVTRSDTVYYLPVAGRDEYFLLENRQPLESDSALLNPARPGGRRPGLLVWHIDAAKVAAEGFRTTNTVNSGLLHGVALVQADGLDQLGAPGGTNRGDSGDPFPGGTDNRQLSWQTSPRAADNAGGFAGFMIDRVAQVVTNGAMSFRFTRRGLSVIASNRPDAVLTVGGRAATRFEDVLVPGDAIAVAAPSPAPSSDAATRYPFASWSNGMPASFTLSPDPGKPDTLTATYDTEYRAEVRLAGTGTVTSTPTAPPGTAGVIDLWARPGDGVTLAATAAPGAQFFGWSGDTTAIDATLVLSMNRPYTVRADFSVSAAVTAVADAVRAVLDEPTGLSQQIRDGLDLAGNRNQQFDVGDVLAFIDQNREEAPASLVRQLLARESMAPAARARAEGRRP